MGRYLPTNSCICEERGNISELKGKISLDRQLLFEQNLALSSFSSFSPKTESHLGMQSGRYCWITAQQRGQLVSFPLCVLVFQCRTKTPCPRGHSATNCWYPRVYSFVDFISASFDIKRSRPKLSVLFHKGCSLNNATIQTEMQLYFDASF